MPELFHVSGCSHRALTSLQVRKSKESKRAHQRIKLKGTVLSFEMNFSILVQALVHRRKLTSNLSAGLLENLSAWIGHVSYVAHWITT